MLDGAKRKQRCPSKLFQLKDQITYPTHQGVKQNVQNRTCNSGVKRQRRNGDETPSHERPLTGPGGPLSKSQSPQSRSKSGSGRSYSSVPPFREEGPPG